MSYLARVKVEVWVYIGKTLVESINGIAYTYAINITMKNVKMLVLEVTLAPFEEKNSEKSARLCSREIAPTVKHVERALTRFERIPDEIDISYLDECEQNEVLNIIEKHANLFHLPGEKSNAK